ncbi:hypothetical protein V5O48_010185 [Marasmius crinis-equi]|uniref:Uncharacterized protein n=1 Tax=Marasmius crinis-equi TaxID=585013 RepID=A0ABR3F904_9AGAR
MNSTPALLPAFEWDTLALQESDDRDKLSDHSDDGSSLFSAEVDCESVEFLDDMIVDDMRTQLSGSEEDEDNSTQNTDSEIAMSSPAGSNDEDEQDDDRETTMSSPTDGDEEDDTEFSVFAVYHDPYPHDDYPMSDESVFGDSDRDQSSRVADYVLHPPQSTNCHTSGDDEDSVMSDADPLFDGNLVNELADIYGDNENKENIAVRTEPVDDDGELTTDDDVEVKIEEEDVQIKIEEEDVQVKVEENNAQVKTEEEDTEFESDEDDEDCESYLDAKVEGNEFDITAENRNISCKAQDTVKEEFKSEEPLVSDNEKTNEADLNDEPDGQATPTSIPLRGPGVDFVLGSPFEMQTPVPAAKPRRSGVGRMARCYGKPRLYVTVPHRNILPPIPAKDRAFFEARLFPFGYEFIWNNECVEMINWMALEYVRGVRGTYIPPTDDLERDNLIQHIRKEDIRKIVYDLLVGHYGHRGISQNLLLDRLSKPFTAEQYVNARSSRIDPWAAQVQFFGSETAKDYIRDECPPALADHVETAIEDEKVFYLKRLGGKPVAEVPPELLGKRRQRAARA